MPLRKPTRALLTLAAALCCLAALALLTAHYAPPRSMERIALSAPRPATRATEAATCKPAAPTGTINLNAADADELCQLTGVGPALARRIIEEREQNGRFAYAEDLLCVRGIGDKTYQKLLGQFCLD